jgi:hypothetical protein
MKEVKDLGDLPPYMRRHLSARYGIGEESWLSADERSSYLNFMLQDRQARGLKYLDLTIRDISYACRTTHDLIRALAELPMDGTAPVIVSELIRRLDELDDSSESQLAETLTEISGGIQEKTQQRLVADRASMRLLYRLKFSRAFGTALACTRSPRATRREASYRFYLTNGIDDAGREALCEKIWNASTRYRQVITTDNAIVRQLTLARVLELAPSTYWRKTAITGMLDEGSHSEVIDICGEYPLELIWAINDKRATSMLPHVMRLLEQYKDDSYLLNRILQCLARLGDADSLSLGMQRAAELVSRDPPGLT